MAGTRKQKETTKQSQTSARTRSSSTAKTTGRSAQASKNKTAKNQTRSTAKKREPEPEYEEDTGFLQSEAVILGNVHRKRSQGEGFSLHKIAFLSCDLSDDYLPVGVNDILAFCGVHKH